MPNMLLVIAQEKGGTDATHASLLFGSMYKGKVVHFDILQLSMNRNCSTPGREDTPRVGNHLRSGSNNDLYK